MISPAHCCRPGNARYPSTCLPGQEGQAYLAATRRRRCLVNGGDRHLVRCAMDCVECFLSAVTEMTDVSLSRML